MTRSALAAAISEAVNGVAEAVGDAGADVVAGGDVTGSLLPHAAVTTDSRMPVANALNPRC
jgi:hypothetical protein